MSKDSFDEQFDSAFEPPAPPARAKAKATAIHQAKTEFRQAFQESSRQSSVRAAKPGFSIKHTLWRLFMSPIENKMAYGAFGTVAVGFLALSLITVLPKKDTDYVTEPVINVPATQTQKNSVDDDLNLNSVLEEVVVTGSRADQAATPAQVAREAGSPLRDESPVVEQGLPTETKRQAGIVSADSDALGQGLSNSELAAISNSAMTSPGLKKQEESRQQQYRRASNQAAPALSAPRSRALPKPKIDDQEAFISAPPSRPDSYEEYADYDSNPVIQVADQAVSTFSIDVDTAAYSLVRNQLNSGLLPKPQAVRAEELINYFDYDYPLPDNKAQPFKPTVSVLDSPWNTGRKLIHIGIKGYDIAPAQQPDSNLVFLLDVSGSMNQSNKLPLVKQSMGLLLDSLKPTDTVSIVVYAGAAGTVLEPTKVSEKATIINSLNNLQAGGSTAGGQGLRLAYNLAEQNFNDESVNRIVLATDGDFNVGQSSNEDLKTLIERKRDNGIFLSVLGFGRNNYQDDMMQTLAQNGNGVAAYIDTLSEAKKVLVDEATSTLFPIAKDVKLQVEFNPNTVADYRLVGYETRALKREDFNNDKVDAGDIGTGHTVTAIYEITPQNSEQKSVDDLRYKTKPTQGEGAQEEGGNSEYGFLKVRYKLPTERTSKLMETAIPATPTKANSETSFAVAVAGFAQLLSNSQHTGSLSYDDVISQAAANKGNDEFGYRTEFIQLARMAKIAQP